MTLNPQSLFFIAVYFIIIVEIEENNTEEQCSSSPLYPACRLHLAAETVDNAIKPSGGGREVMVLGCILRLGNTLTNRGI